MTSLTTLADGVADLVHDGDTVALEGFTHLIPFAAGHEVIRQGRTDLTLVRMTPDLLYDQMIGMGCAKGLVFSYGGNPGVGSLHRFRDAIENGWPRPLEVEEHSHAGMANRYAASAAGLPMAIMRGDVGPDLMAHTRVEQIECPSPERSWSRCRRSTSTWRSSMPRKPTATATSSSGASPGCRRRRCWERGARW